MKSEEALTTLEEILGEEFLNNLQKTVFCLSCERKSYPEIAKHLGYDDDYIKYVGFQLWKMLSVVLGEKVTKNNFQAVIMKWRSRSLDSSLRKQKTILVENQKSRLVETESEMTHACNPNIR
jgi:hypothetical protein